VVILGGGVGSVTAALKLSKPGWEKHYASITIYQQGWRLGGKGASGRGPGMRIEEHGLHIWLGFYENAFQMLRACHDELHELATGPAGKPRWPLAFSNIEDSFTAANDIRLTDHDGCSWKLWATDYFEYNDDRPWLQDDPRAPYANPDHAGPLFYAARCLELAADVAASLVVSDSRLQVLVGPSAAVEQRVRTVETAFEALWGSLTSDVQQVLGTAAEALDSLAEEAARAPLTLDALDVTLRALEIALGYLRGRWDAEVRGSDTLRRCWYLVDLLIATVRGLIEDGVIAADDFGAVDDVDFRSWLLAHGASRDTVECALVRTLVYDLPFAYRGGDPQRPACSAGVALRGMLRLFFGFRGSVMWKMNAGMGDVVFAPIYELLIKRGVEVKFFHRVEQVRASGNSIDEIEIDVQADMAPGTAPRDYLLSPEAVWPSDPEAIVASPKPSSPSVYESWYRDPADTRVRTVTLKRGDPGDGFELVVFGLPVSCVENVAPDLPAQSLRWKGAVQRLETVATQAMQLWLDTPASQLGDAPEGVVLSGYVEPFDTWADMPQLVPQEQVGSATVAYFCNTFAATPPPARGAANKWLDDQYALVREQALRFLRRNVGALWPHAVDPISHVFDWDRLIAPAGDLGETRLDAQYLRANVEPSELYVLSVPGSARYRIPPDKTDFENLYAVGDWTACKLDAGCVEGAVISGTIAANAIHRGYGDPQDVETIIGLRGP
jgi:uncharacterized protein with NAD-binding domain and iron-sulfur cluster